jgi:hypothetical protein
MSESASGGGESSASPANRPATASTPCARSWRATTDPRAARLPGLRRRQVPHRDHPRLHRGRGADVLAARLASPQDLAPPSGRCAVGADRRARRPAQLGRYGQHLQPCARGRVRARLRIVDLAGRFDGNSASMRPFRKLSPAARIFLSWLFLVLALNRDAAEDWPLASVGLLEDISGAVAESAYPRVVVRLSGAH